MAKRCPNGVICIENMTLLFIVILVTLIALFLFNNFIKQTNSNSLKENNVDIIERKNNPIFLKQDSYYTNEESDIFLNPHTPPLKENRFFPEPSIKFPFHYPHRNRYENGIQTNMIRGIPINMSTSQYDFSYKQVGILTRSDGNEKILPVFGRPLHSNRNKWQYYTMTDGNTMIKLPVSKGGRSCTGDFGCDELFNGDNVYVEGYKDSFDVTIYENDRPQYIPYL